MSQCVVAGGVCLVWWHEVGYGDRSVVTSVFGMGDRNIVFAGDRSVVVW